VRLLRLAWLALAATLTQACLVVSLHPVYDPETIGFDAALVGTWASQEDTATVTFDRGEWHSYHITIVDGSKTDRFSARLTRVGDLQLLDVAPLDGTDIPDLVIPVHIIYKIAVDADTVSLSALNYDRFYEMAKVGKTDAGSGAGRAERTPCSRADARPAAVAAGARRRRWSVRRAGDIEAESGERLRRTEAQRRTEVLRHGSGGQLPCGADFSLLCSPVVGRRDVLSHQLAAQNLADEALRQLRAELDRLRHLERRELSRGRTFAVPRRSPAGPREAPPTP
jgi:hypothetical protein